MRQGAGPHLRRNLIVLAVVSVVYLVAALFVTNSYYQLILTLVPVWALFGVSWNILSGYAGQLSFGHASFFGIGAYTVTLSVVYWSLSPWLGIPLGMVIGGLAAIAIGFPTFRLRGHYFALSMLAYPLAILYVMQYLGFQEVSMPMHRDNAAAFMEFNDPRVYTLLAVLLLVGGVVVSLVIENSRFGLALLAIRQNELAAEAAGINARLWKMRSLVVSGMMGAVAGGFDVKKTGTTRKIAGYNCENWTVTMGQFSKSEQCMTTELAVPVQAWDTYREFAEGMRSMMASMGPMGKGMADIAAKMKEMRGFPLAVSTTSSIMGRSMSSSSEVVEVKKGAIPASAWEVPAGYRKIDNPMLKAMAPAR